jgi:ABC-type amino acid transport substrate-binding protein/ABC-type branched-subunit amino acid transport system substrate-binding protein
LLGLFKDRNDSCKPVVLALQPRAMFIAAVLLSQQYNITVGGQLIGWQTVSTDGEPINALRNSCRAMSSSNIVGIVGPGLSREALMIAPLGKTIGIPVVSYAATDPDLSDRNAYPTFYRTVPSDNAAAVAIAQLFVRFNWTSCIIIYQNDAYGEGGLKAINQAFDKKNLIIRGTISFDIMARSIQRDLKKDLLNSPTRIIILWADLIHTSLVIDNALDNDLLGPQFTWITTSRVLLDLFNETDHDKLIGILTIEPVVASTVNASVNTTLLNAALNIWQQYEPESFPGMMNIRDSAFFSFDATWLLIQALQQYCSTRLSPCIQIVNSSLCFDRLLLNSTSFINTISTTTFLGVSGLVQYGVNLTDRVLGTYYYLQNVQPSIDGLEYTPVLVWSDLQDWRPCRQSHVIVWPGNSLIIPTGRAKLSGVSLKVLVGNSPSFITITHIIDEYGKDKMTFSGYVPDLIDLLGSRMGFIPELILATGTSYVKIMQDVANGDYDMFVSDTTITASRREIADFSNAIFDNALRLVVRKKSDVTIDLLSFLKPFTWNLWLLILVANIYAALLLFLYEREENDALRDKSITSSVAMSGWFSVGTLMGYGVDFKVRTAAGRLLTTGLYILSLILVATYTANLASNLTLLKPKNIISEIEDIKNGQIPFNRIGIRINTAAEDYYLREISHGIRNFYPLQSRQETIDSLLNGTIDVTFMDSAAAESLTGSFYCNLTLVGAPFDFGSFGIVTPKQWIYGEELDVSILSLQESGAFDDLKRKWFPTNSCFDSFDTTMSMGVDTLCGLLLVFAVISVLSWFLFAWQKRYVIKKCLTGRTVLKISSRENDQSLKKPEKLCSLKRYSSLVNISIQMNP